MLHTRESPSALDNLTFSHGYRAPIEQRHAGGDVATLTNHDDGTTALLLADVSAKGGEGTAFASRLADLFTVSATFVRRPSHILGQLNTTLCDAFSDKSRGLFACALVCRFFPRYRRLVYACAGIEYPILFNDTRPPRYLDCGGIVLGVDKRATYEDAIIAMNPDDVLIAYTDGITESLRTSGSERLGVDGMLEAIRQSVGYLGRPDSHDILHEVDSLNGGRYNDDATLAVVGLKERPCEEKSR